MAILTVKIFKKLGFVLLLILKFENLENIPEFRELSNQFQKRMRNQIIRINSGYKILRNQ